MLLMTIYLELITLAQKKLDFATALQVIALCVFVPCMVLFCPFDCHFYTIYTDVSKINSVYGNLKGQMKLDLCICEALIYTSVPWKPYLWTWLSSTTNIN